MPDDKQAKSKVSAVSAAFVENSSFLKKFLTRFFSSPQDIEDVAQESYLRAYIAEQKSGVHQPKAFLFRVVKNVAFTKLSKKSRQITDYLEDFASSEVFDSEASIEEQLEAEELLGLYVEAVARLPEKYRQVFLLRKVHGLAHKEIAERISVSSSSVDKYLRHAMAACDSYIGQQEGRHLEESLSNRVPPSGKTQK